MRKRPLILAVSLIVLVLITPSGSLDALSWRFRHTTRSTVNASSSTTVLTTTTTTAAPTTIAPTTAAPVTTAPVTTAAPTTTTAHPVAPPAPAPTPAPPSPGLPSLTSSVVSTWTTPVSSLVRTDRDWASRLFKYGSLGTSGAAGQWQMDFGFGPWDYSIPVYDIAKVATTPRRVFKKSSFPGAWNIGNGTTIPWSDTFKPSGGSDGFMVVIDSRTGQEWDFWNVSFPGYSTPSNNSGGCFSLDNIFAGFSVNNDVCAASAYIISSPNGQVADFRNYAGNAPGASGVGLQNTAGLVTPDEVATGTVKHAWKFMAGNTMFGPQCSDADAADSSKLGFTCGSAVAPAGKFERVSDTDGCFAGACIDGANPNERRSHSVPEGTRFSLDISDAQIASWLDSRGYAGRKRETARVMAVSLRDYGWLLTDTSGGSAFFQLSGAKNPATGTAWRNLGVDGTGSDLLVGLVTESRVVAYQPPSNTCGDNRLHKFFCWSWGTQ